jgi:hypothetical protein
MTITDRELAIINRKLLAAQSDLTAFPAPDGGVRIMAPEEQHVADFPAGTSVEALLAAERAVRRAWSLGFKAGRADGLKDAALQAFDEGQGRPTPMEQAAK